MRTKKLLGASEYKDEKRIKREFRAALHAMQNDYPLAVDWNVISDSYVEVQDKDDNVLAIIHIDKITSYYNF